MATLKLVKNGRITHLLLGRTASLILLILGLATACNRANDVTGPSDGSRTGRAVIHESGWSSPLRLDVSDNGWEDSTYLTRDGTQILFFYHPAPDIVTDPTAGPRIQQDGRIFATNRPFVSKSQHPVSRADGTSEGGPYISAAGTLFFHRTFFPSPNRIVRGGQVLELGTPGHQSNPHYCDAQDELYYDDDAHDIWMYKNGVSRRLPPPINVAGLDYQAFLTDDCQTLYFTSNRAAGGAGLPFHVYRAARAGEFAWHQPVLFISHPDGVGEFSMSRSGNRVVFIELTRRAGGGLGTDIYSATR